MATSAELNFAGRAGHLYACEYGSRDDLRDAQATASDGHGPGRAGP